MEIPTILREKTYEVEDHVSPREVGSDRDDRKETDMGRFFGDDIDHQEEVERVSGSRSHSHSIVSIETKLTMDQYGSGGSIVDEMMNDFDEEELETLKSILSDEDGNGGDHHFQWE